MKTIIALLLLFCSTYVFSAAPHCVTTSSGVHLIQWEGTVDQLYINSGNTILIYFDTALPLAEAQECNFSPANRSAATYKLSDNPEFGKLLYSTALAAQMSNKPIVLQMYSVSSGYMKLDRIWLKN